uniref:Uncharacterized protein n=1 Tax=Crocodylus porosus TaxID=8502 RepID=A0A7M4FDU8_CROPO
LWQTYLLCRNTPVDGDLGWLSMRVLQCGGCLPINPGPWICAWGRDRLPMLAWLFTTLPLAQELRVMPCASAPATGTSSTDRGMERSIQVVNQRVRHWCHWEGFGFHDHSLLFGERQ